MEAKKSTFTQRTPEEIRAWFNRAKARQQQLEEEGRRMWEEEQRIKAEAEKAFITETITKGYREMQEGNFAGKGLTSLDSLVKELRAEV